MPPHRLLGRLRQSSLIRGRYVSSNSCLRSLPLIRYRQAAPFSVVPRSLSTASSVSAAASTSASAADDDDDVPAMPMPTRAHPRIFPAAPLSRIGFGSQVRPTVSSADVRSSLSSYLQHGGNVLELARGHVDAAAEALRSHLEQHGEEAAARVMLVAPVSWRDVVQWVEQQRVERREQQRVQEELSHRRQRRHRIRQLNLQNLQRDAQQQQKQDEALADLSAIYQQTDTPALPPPTAPSPAASSSSSASPSSSSPPAADDELLPVHKLDLISTDEPMVFSPSFDIFPYLHAYLSSLLSTAGLHHVHLVLVDDVDLIPQQHRLRYLQALFLALEQCVLAGKTAGYGVASSRFGLSRGDADSLTVEQCLQLARELLEEPHFRAIRFPLNVYQIAVMTESNCSLTDGSPATALQFARSAGLLCLSDGLVDGVDPTGEERRLRAAEEADGSLIARELKAAFNGAIWLEKQYEAMLRQQAEGRAERKEAKEEEAAEAGAVPRMDVSWAHVMMAQMPQLDNAVRWERALHDSIQPRLSAALSRLSALQPRSASSSGSEQPLVRWTQQYRHITAALFSAFTASVNLSNGHHCALLSQLLDSLCPALSAFPLLEHKCLLLALCTDVDCVMTPDVDVGVAVLQLAAAAADGSQTAADFPSRLLTAEQALDVMRRCQEHFMQQQDT